MLGLLRVPAMKKGHPENVEGRPNLSNKRLLKALAEISR
jgi:hypothetical protein